MSVAQALSRVGVLILPLTAFSVLNVAGDSLAATYLAVGLLGLWGLASGWRWTLAGQVKWALAIVALIAVGSALAILSAPTIAPLHAALATKLAKQLLNWAVMVAHLIVFATWWSMAGHGEVRAALHLYVLVTVIAALYGVYQFVGFVHHLPVPDLFRNSLAYARTLSADVTGWAGLPRARGFSPEPSMWAAQAATALPFCELVRSRLGRTVARAVLVVAILLSFSRTGLLLLVLYWLSGLSWRRALATGGAVGLALWVGTQSRVFHPTMQIAARAVALSDLSAAQRLRTQQEAFETFVSHPVLGAGWGAFEELRSNESPFATTANFYLTVAAGSGLVGLLVLAGFLASLGLGLVVASRHGGAEVQGLARALVKSTLLVAGGWLTVASYNFSYIWILFAAAVAISPLGRSSERLPIRQT